jgi:hypothetical protein
MHLKEKLVISVPFVIRNFGTSLQRLYNCDFFFCFYSLLIYVKVFPPVKLLCVLIEKHVLTSSLHFKEISILCTHDMTILRPFIEFFGPFVKFLAR